MVGTSASGRRTLPTKIKEIKGTKQNCLQNQGEPLSVPPVGVHPFWLKDKRAIEKWHEMFNLLNELGTLSETDKDSLGHYCELWFRWHDNNLLLDAEEPASNAYMKFWRIRNDMLDRIMRFQSEFGLTPSSRAKVKTTKPEKRLNNPFEIIKGGNANVKKLLKSS